MKLWPFLILLLLCGCSDDDQDFDSGVTRDLGSWPEKQVCKRPPSISHCTGPGTGVCPTRTLCMGCNCSGMAPVFACDSFNGDCRWFCTGCYPNDYTLCDQNAPKSILGVCGYCISDSGPPGKCNKVYIDHGATKKDGGAAN